MLGQHLQFDVGRIVHHQPFMQVLCKDGKASSAIESIYRFQLGLRRSCQAATLSSQAALQEMPCSCAAMQNISPADATKLLTKLAHGQGGNRVAVPARSRTT